MNGPIEGAIKSRAASIFALPSLANMSKKSRKLHRTKGRNNNRQCRKLGLVPNSGMDIVPNVQNPWSVGMLAKRLWHRRLPWNRRSNVGIVYTSFWTDGRKRPLDLLEVAGTSKKQRMIIKGNNPTIIPQVMALETNLNVSNTDNEIESEKGFAVVEPNQPPLFI
ncbi:OLC1v1036479C1 [Oldenlandia corymbosa var. corymbosa]|uniref:OLC1v1036479C1 n=1 Tax=Oldenlandia corymbosa var. corymbosa TaxID=529605 RepID=A0AAV1CYY7_OLDCO|nr:OLC1v1036479C1 [Oldenlandia corymbosa var. corymbosa]